MARTKRHQPTGLPQYVRRHGSGFRAVFHVDFAPHVGPTYRTAAEAAAYARRHGAILDQHGGDPAVLTLQQAVDLLFVDLERTGARPDTFDYYAKYTDPLLARWGTERPLHDIDERSVRAFVLDRSKRVSPQTVYRHELAVARRVFRLATEAGYLHVDPTAKVKSPKLRRPRFEFLDREVILGSVAKILASEMPQRRLHADVVLLFFYTGLRLAEVGRLRVGDYRIAGKSATLFVEGKTGNRDVPVAKALQPTIARAVAGKTGDDPLLGRGKRRLASRIFDLWRERLGHEHFSPHVMRHSYATAMVRLGVSPFDLQVLMGHASIEETMRYYHAVGPHLQSAVDALGGGRRLAGSRSRGRVGVPAGRRAGSPARA